MKLYTSRGTRIVESETIVKIAGFISAGKFGMQKAKAMAFFPLVFVRKREYATPVFINHEKIHWRQQWELLFIGMSILRIYEDLYSGLVLGLDASDRYLYRAAEQEAYRNQLDLNYLEHRKPYSVLKYLTDKKKLTFIPNRSPEVKTGEGWTRIKSSNIVP